MTNEQLYLAIGVPIALNLIFNGVMFLMLGARMQDGFTAVHKRIDEMRDLWRAELRRVEEVLDARLKHLEESR
jgi:hypothetical protein